MKITALILFSLCLLVKESQSRNPVDVLVFCECGGILKMDSTNVEMNVAEHFLKQDIIDTNFFGHRYKNCSLCRVTLNMCYGDPQNSAQYNCTKEIVTLKKPEPTFPLVGEPLILALQKNQNRYLRRVKTPAEAEPIHRRFARQLDSCTYPTSLRTAELDCTIYPSSVRCSQRCAFGYTLDEGTQVVRTCKKKQNTWKPSGFRECRPFVDCGLTLVSGGKFTCTTPLVKRGPECRVSCDRFEDKKATREKTHSCDSKGKWTPKLPFCVAPGSGLQLVPIPKF